mmetsp:Transcript_12638/g.31834  ORF Transcript_12638/g.31834 Transcript_12638/m.31834 type:complete len:149 (-) Transcript_12638:1173-1619(-)
MESICGTRRILRNRLCIFNKLNRLQRVQFSSQKQGQNMKIFQNTKDSRCLDTGLLASRAEVEPEVENAAGDVVSTESIEGDLGSSSLESDTEHGGDDESTVRSNGGRPSKNSSCFLRREEDTNGTEGSSVHESSTEEEIEEQEDEPSV